MQENNKFREFASRLESYCDYQERCKYDVVNKMAVLDVPIEMQNSLLEYLQEFSFLNQQRYVHAFVNGKLKYKKWGRRKIYASLRAKRVDSSDINFAFESIDEDEYYEIMKTVCDYKLRSIGNVDTDINKKKLLNFINQRGFESGLVWNYIAELKSL